MKTPDFDSKKLFVGGIPRDTTEVDLKDHFSRYGEVSFSTIAKDRVTAIPRGFGFVIFTDPSSSETALADHHEILGKKVEVKRAIPRVEQQQFPQIKVRGKKIFVGGLSSNLSEEEFRGYFEKFGRITDLVMMYASTTNKPRGFGFVTFDSEDVVEEILKDSFHELGGKFVEVKRAIPKDPIYNGQISVVSRQVWEDYWLQNYHYNCYLSHYLMSPYGYDGVYNAGYHMAGYGFSALPWNAEFDAASDGVGDSLVSGKSSCVDGSSDSAPRNKC